MTAKVEQTTPEALDEAGVSEKPRKPWHAPKFMLSKISETSNTSANSSDHHGGSIS